jgi:hypothetical protein
MKIRLQLVLYGDLRCVGGSERQSDKVETGVRSVPIVGSADPNADLSTYYASAFQFSNDGQQALLYVHGDDGISADLAKHRVATMRSPAPQSEHLGGLTSPYQRIKTILPDASQGHPGWDPVAQSMWLYGHPAVTKNNGKFYLIAHKSPNAVRFQRQLWGVSSDGENFTWYPLIHWNVVSSADKIPTVTVEADFSANYFWGFIDVEWRTGPKGIGAIRMRRSSVDPRGYDRVEIWSSGIWRATATDGTFTFRPDIIWSGPATSKLMWDSGKWYLWASVGGPRAACSLDGCPLQNEFDGLLDRFVCEVTNWQWAGDTRRDPERVVTARCMPGKYDGSRIYPCRWARCSTRRRTIKCSANNFTVTTLCGRG